MLRCGASAMTAVQVRWVISSGRGTRILERLRANPVPDFPPQASHPVQHWLTTSGHEATTAAQGCRAPAGATYPLTALAAIFGFDAML